MEDFFTYYSFKLLGSNNVKDTLENRFVTINISENDRISVKPGDFIGKSWPYHYNSC